MHTSHVQWLQARPFRPVKQRSTHPQSCCSFGKSPWLGSRRNFLEAMPTRTSSIKASYNSVFFSIFQAWSIWMGQPENTYGFSGVVSTTRKLGSSPRFQMYWFEGKSTGNSVFPPKFQKVSCSFSLKPTGFSGQSRVQLSKFAKLQFPSPSASGFKMARAAKDHAMWPNSWAAKALEQCPRCRFNVLLHTYT